MRKNQLAAALLLCGLLLTGCGGEQSEPNRNPADETGYIPAETETDPPSDPLPDTVTEEETAPPAPAVPSGEVLAEAIRNLPDSDALRQADIADLLTGDRLDTLPAEQKTALEAAIPGCASLTEMRRVFREITGYTFHAWREVLAGRPAAPYEDGTASLLFTGDVCLGDEWYNMQAYHRMGSDITNNITEALRSWIAGADVALMNCECTLSDRGEPTPGKLYTFRGKPENAQIFASLGVDIVSLANNHAHDYGRDAFLDTMTALDEAGVAYVGAGANLAEAMAYRSFVADGMKIAFVSASNAEKYRLTPGASADSPGILLMYDETDVLAALDTAAREADAVVVYVHWGTENDTAVNADQQKKRDLFIGHGADAIVGAHPHVLQPWEIYEGVPVVYSLGNFWFNMETVDTAVAVMDVQLTDTGVAADCALYACVQSRGITGFREEMQ